MFHNFSFPDYKVKDMFNLNLLLRWYLNGAL